MDILVSFLVLFLLLFLGMPIAYAMGLIGTLGIAWRIGLAPALSSVGTTASDTVLSYDFAVLPLFILMGNLIAGSGISRELYLAANAWLGHFRGGLAMATVVACAAFSAVCGSSLATAGTMAKVAVPPMRKFGYADSLAAGSVAAGGTLGVMIPPSIPMVFYGIMTQTDIGSMFIAGILPGLLGAALYCTAVAAATRLRPSLGPAAPKAPFLARVQALRGTYGMLALFALVIGGIYGGLFTPTEAAAIGALGGLSLALVRRNLSRHELTEIFISSAKMSVMMMAILVGALIFSTYINTTALPQQVAEWVNSLNVTPILVIFVIVIIYIFLGCIMEALSMMLLTVPVFYPVVAALGYDLIWFGILVITVLEIGLITPPIGLNVFVLRAVLPDIPMKAIFRGVLPFILADFVRVALLIAFPIISLFLPSMMH